MFIYKISRPVVGDSKGEFIIYCKDVESVYRVIDEYFKKHGNLWRFKIESINCV